MAELLERPEKLVRKEKVYFAIKEQKFQEDEKEISKKSGWWDLLRMEEDVRKRWNRERVVVNAWLNGGGWWLSTAANGRKVAGWARRQ
ncbi:uncharacterized protein G2W53_041198 [Senna tora]|uniref:Uncharacterized protein n=1 Tax=Senna tora TaxID=362788 RepID=A0A834VYI3_9FABA|nr:uncharacterized protein G2W53_041198 [Senna tora]